MRKPVEKKFKGGQIPPPYHGQMAPPFGLSRTNCPPYHGQIAPPITDKLPLAYYTIKDKKSLTSPLKEI